MKIFVESAAFSFPIGVIKAHIDEGINQITMIELELVSSSALKKEDIDGAVGCAVTLTVEDLIDNALHKVRWDGLVFELIDATNGKSDGGLFFYTMIVRPKLWQLNYSTNCRSYPNMSRIQVIDELLKEHGFIENSAYQKDYHKEDAYPVFNQLLQTGNSDLTFLKSLLVNAGINFYFSCDEDGAAEEMLCLLDEVAFFPNYAEEVPIVSASGMIQATRRISEITRLTRAVPSKVASTALLADGSVRPMSNTGPVDNSATEGVVNVFVPEGLSDAEKTASQASKIASEGFSAARIVHQGLCDHIRVRPGRRISVKNYNTAESYKILVTRARHIFEQKPLAALSETGGGDPAYKNYFTAAEPMAPIRPSEAWTDVDTSMTLDSSPTLNPEGSPSLTPKFKHISNMAFNAADDPSENTRAIKELAATVSMLQEQVRALKNQVKALQIENSANASGLVCAEITKDAWVTEGKELVCMVKAEEFEEPIRVKVATAWHDKGGGMLHLPRKGNFVWIQRIHRSKGNDWVIVGYRPTGTVASSNDPAKSFTIKQLG